MIFEKLSGMNFGERENEYRKMAAKFIDAPVDVRFQYADQMPRGVDGERVPGRICWKALEGHYLIELSDSIPLKEEKQIFCHEVAHGELDHVRTALTPADIDEIVRSPRAAKSADERAGLIHLAEQTISYIDREQRGHERQADERGRELYHALFPGEDFL
jgi:hypothetical protein